MMSLDEIINRIKAQKEHPSMSNNFEYLVTTDDVLYYLEQYRRLMEWLKRI